MAGIKEQLEKLGGFIGSGGVSCQAINAAEDALGIRFAPAHEWFGHLHALPA